MAQKSRSTTGFLAAFAKHKNHCVFHLLSLRSFETNVNGSLITAEHTFGGQWCTLPFLMWISRSIAKNRIAGPHLVVRENSWGVGAIAFANNFRGCAVEQSTSDASAYEREHLTTAR